MSITIKTETVRGKKKWVIDMRSIGAGREYFGDSHSANEKLQEIQKNGIEAANISTEDRMTMVECKRILAPFKVSVRDAVRFYVSQHHAREEKPIAEAVRLFIDSKEKKRRRLKYTDLLRYDLVPFATAFDGRKCHEITHTEIDTWLHEGWKVAKTIDGKFINLRTFFSFALKQGWVHQNPCAKIDRLTIDRKRPGILTVEQAAKLMEAAQRVRPDILTHLALALFAGVRKEELSKLTRENISSDGTLWIDENVSKVHLSRIVHLTENCKAWVDLGGEVFPKGIRSALHEVRKAAGFEYSIGAKRKGKKAKMMPGIPWPKNCLRHSFCSYYMVIHGTALTAVEAGNSEKIIHRDYKKPVSKADAELFWKILPS